VEKLVSLFRAAQHVEIPICLFPDQVQVSMIELHAFGDASEEIYAAVIYLRVVYSDGRNLVRQVKAVNKISPKKTISVPKLELNAAEVGGCSTSSNVSFHPRAKDPAAFSMDG
jgi:hypothetical protein